MLGENDLTNNGRCTGCGACCGSILPMSRKETSKIRGYIKKHNIAVKKSIDPLTCPFLDVKKKKDKCRIYPVRPAICKLFKCNKRKADGVMKADGVYNMNDIFGGVGND